jgi:hypothetical protein
MTPDVRPPLKRRFVLGGFGQQAPPGIDWVSFRGAAAASAAMLLGSGNGLLRRSLETGLSDGDRAIGYCHVK